MEINLKPVAFCNIESTPKAEGQLLYAIDTGNSTFDLSGVTRVDLNCVTILDTEGERETLDKSEISMDRLYVCQNTNKMYRYFAIGWVWVYDYSQIQDLVIPALELQPFVLKDTLGNNCAPQVLADFVFMNDGSTLQSHIDTLLNKGMKVTLESKTVPIELSEDFQKVVDIPFPTVNYDLYHYPITMFKEQVHTCSDGQQYKYNEKIDNDKYAIGKEQIIFSDQIAVNNKKGQIITFVFAWANTVMDTDTDCKSVNGVRIFQGIHDIPKDERQDGDIMFNSDPTKMEIKKWDEELDDWVYYCSAQNRTVTRIQNTVTLYSSVDKVNIGIQLYNKETDTLIVIKNTVILTEGLHYTISDDSESILAPEGFNWINTNNNMKFTFIVLKNVPSADNIIIGSEGETDDLEEDETK